VKPGGTRLAGSPPHVLPGAAGGAVTAAGFPDPATAVDAVLPYVIGMSTTEAARLATGAPGGAGTRACP
jgi:hypothetical protein